LTVATTTTTTITTTTITLSPQTCHLLWKQLEIRKSDENTCHESFVRLTRHSSLSELAGGNSSNSERPASPKGSFLVNKQHGYGMTSSRPHVPSELLHSNLVKFTRQRSHLLASCMSHRTFLQSSTVSDAQIRYSLVQERRSGPDIGRNLPACVALLLSPGNLRGTIPSHPIPCWTVNDVSAWISREWEKQCLMLIWRIALPRRLSRLSLTVNNDLNLGLVLDCI
jgi:hypothetical protein